MLSCTPGGRKWKFNPLSINTRYSRLGDSKRNLWVGIFAFVGVVDGAWQHGESVMAFRVKNYEIVGVFI